MVITTAKLHSAKPELRFCAGSNPACGVLDICYTTKTIPQKKNTSSSSLSKWLWPQKKIHHLHHYQSDFESSIGPTVVSDNGNEPTNGDKWTDKWLWTLTKVGARQRVLLTPFLQLPSFSPSVLQSLLKRYAAFRMYKEDLVIEEYSASHRLGVSWKSICANEHCKLEK